MKTTEQLYNEVCVERDKLVAEKKALDYQIVKLREIRRTDLNTLINSGVEMRLKEHLEKLNGVDWTQKFLDLSKSLEKYKERLKIIKTAARKVCDDAYLFDSDSESGSVEGLARLLEGDDRMDK